MSSTTQETVERKLRTAFSPTRLEVVNESYKHAGHHHDDGRSFDGTGETHFRIKITSKSFDGMKKVDIHRAINHVLKHEMDNGIHALAIEAKAD